MAGCCWANTLRTFWRIIFCSSWEFTDPRTQWQKSLAFSKTGARTSNDEQFWANIDMFVYAVAVAWPFYKAKQQLRQQEICGSAAPPVGRKGSSISIYSEQIAASVKAYRFCLSLYKRKTHTASEWTVFTQIQDDCTIILWILCPHFSNEEWGKKFSSCIQINIVMWCFWNCYLFVCIVIYVSYYLC